MNYTIYILIKDAKGDTVSSKFMEKKQFEKMSRSRIDMAILYDDFSSKVNGLLKLLGLKEDES